MDAGRIEELEKEVAHLGSLLETVGTLAVMALELQGVVVPEDETFEHLLERLEEKPLARMGGDHRREDDE